MWLGTAAIVLAMGGTATAASMVTSAQIKDGTITAKDIKRGAIGLTQLSSTARDGIQGEPGLTGPSGPAGPAGPAGPSAVGQINYVRSQRVYWNGTYVQSAMATCPAGQRAISGGGVSVGDAGMAASDTVASRSGWYVIGGMSYQGNTTAYVEAFAICAPTAYAVAASTDKTVAADKAAIARLVKRYEASISCTSAKIGGAKKCIARGQFCAIRNQKDYKRHGFTCRQDKAGRYRLS
ncbi:hypothetical protein OJ997_06530 [Solirubrobacter phytolaccae]|uniref:Collagen-like protein n=1 Tax=Solirubrobacter phytolaccae TaxID=1404360 RepID=A0A9X3S770_9ACTN|nr:hypothetical protein [Solirubrobacter phytolaccae]MDA0179943.1 hypothetical protein [Solirubrobacter phytolaccae]